MLHVEVSRMTRDQRQLADAVSYLTSEIRPIVERQPGNLGTSLLLDPEAVPVLADTSGFCAALLYADRASGRVISETVWQDPQALAASRHAAAAGEAAAAQALNGVIGASGEYRLVFSSARSA